MGLNYMISSASYNEICIKLVIAFSCSVGQVNPYYDYKEVIDSDEELDLASMVTS